MKKGRTLIFKFIYIFFLAVFVVTGLKLMKNMSDARKAQALYSEMSGSSEDLSEDPKTATGSDSSYEKISGELSLFRLKFNKYKADFDELIFWLNIPGTDTDLPVMQSEDNSYYLHRLPDKSYNAPGSLFLDYRCNKDSTNLVIYGHNGVNGRMFGGLKRYADSDYLSLHPYIILADSDSVYKCPIFSVREVEASGDAYTIDFERDEDLLLYLEKAARDSLCQTDVHMSDVKRIVTLSTCTSVSDSKRFIVQAVIEQQ